MKWKGAGKWTLKSAQDVGNLKLLQMDLQSKAELAQFYYNQFNLRVNTYNPGELPFAFTQLLHSFDRAQKSDKLSPLQKRITIDNPVVVPKGRYRELNYPFSEMDNPNASLNNYIRRMQNFFDAKTSTLAGWREVGRQQDLAFFGGERGKKYHYEKGEDGKRHRVYEMEPKQHLSDSDRRKLWKIIDMAKDAGWLNRFGYDSGQAHKEIASLWLKGEFENPEEDIDAAYNSILKAMERKEAERGQLQDIMPGIEGNPTHRNADEEGDILVGSSQPDRDLLS